MVNVDSLVSVALSRDSFEVFPVQFDTNKQEPMWTCDKLQRADLTYYIARGIREAINTQYEIDSLIAHI